MSTATVVTIFHPPANDPPADFIEWADTMRTTASESTDFRVSVLADPHLDWGTRRHLCQRAGAAPLVRQLGPPTVAQRRQAVRNSSCHRRHRDRRGQRSAVRRRLLSAHGGGGPRRRLRSGRGSAGGGERSVQRVRRMLHLRPPGHRRRFVRGAAVPYRTPTRDVAGVSGTPRRAGGAAAVEPDPRILHGVLDHDLRQHRADRKTATPRSLRDGRPRC